MVSSISSTPGLPVADNAPKLGTGGHGTPARIIAPSSGPSPQQVEAAVKAAKAEVVAKAAAPAPSNPLVSTPLVPPLTSLALFKDSESGLNVSIVRDRVSGQVVEQTPNERTRRLAAMTRQQEELAQQLQRAEVATRLDLET